MGFYYTPWAIKFKDCWVLLRDSHLLHGLVYLGGSVCSVSLRPSSCNSNTSARVELWGM